jgi:uncharacterized membrane protein HdeD (DUF308 family)
MLGVGVVSLAVGLVAVFRPGATLFALVLLIAFNALVIGILDIALAIRVRKEIEHEWLLLLTGVLSAAFGLLVVMFPPAGALALAFFVSSYAIATGLLLLALGYCARRWQQHPGRHRPLHDPTAHPHGT